MDLWQLIRSHRDNILWLAQEFVGAGGDGVKGPDALLRELERETERYMTAMEVVVHPILARDKATRSYVDDLEQEHVELRRHLDDLRAASARGGREWTRRRHALVFALQHYFNLQEHGALTAARAAIARRGKALRRAFELGPEAARRAQRWHVPEALSPDRYGVPAGAALGLVLGVLSLAIAAVTWRRRSAARGRARPDRAEREPSPALVH
jgi:hypothetical protein